MDAVRLLLLVALVVVLAIGGYSMWKKYHKHQRRRNL
jgi:uncharacterized membrane protein